MSIGAPKGNKNAEKWTEKEAVDLLKNAIALSDQKSDDSQSYLYDFIGEVARELNTSHQKLTYIADKYPSVKELHELLKSNLEANCFSNAKKGKIKEATAIVNLKSNYRWTDRIDQTGKVVSYNVELTKDEIKTLDKELEDEV